jgi:hypothetical protein
MKKTAITLAGIIIAVIGLHAFKSYQTSAVTGRMEIYPKGSRIIARNGTDSVFTYLSADGSFSVNLTKGIWQLEVERDTGDNYTRNIIIDSMIIGEPDNIDLGKISPGL